MQPFPSPRWQALQRRQPPRARSQAAEFLHAAGIGPGKSLRVMSQNYDQTVLIDLPTGNAILGRPAAEAVWLRPER
ncbi:MAG: hypothetical protein WDM87_00250 [Terracidiphilus sp.]